MGTGRRKSAARSLSAMIATAFLAIAGPVSLRAQAPAGGLAPARIAAVERLITTEQSRQQIPGLSAAVVTGREMRWSGGYGYSDLENFVPATAGTVYRLASISKPITAVAALQMMEAGKLDLDVPVQKYVPRFPAKPWPVTTRQLLGHLGGVRHYKPGEVESTRRYASVTEALSIFEQDPLAHEPGSKYLYSTYGFNLVGAAVESAAGVPFVAYLQQRVFGPSGMVTARDDDASVLISRRAQGYRRLPNGDLRNSVLADVSNKIPGGGLCSTAEDLARFAATLEKGGLLRAESRALMWTRGKLTDGKETGYGLGWVITERNGRREVAHGGGQPRVSTYLYLLPAEGCAVALMSNLEGARLTDLARKIADELLAP